MTSKKKALKEAFWAQKREERRQREIKDRANLELIASWSGAGLWLPILDPVIGQPRFVKFARGSHRLVFDLAFYDGGSISQDMDDEAEDNPRQYLNGEARLIKDSLGIVFEKLAQFQNDYEYSTFFKGEKWPFGAELPENDPPLDERQELLIVCNYEPAADKSTETKDPFILHVPVDMQDRDFVKIEGNAISRMRFVAFKSRAFIVFSRFATDTVITFGYLDKDNARRIFDTLKKELDTHQRPGTSYTMSENLEE